MVAVAQLVESRIVIPVVVGSSPISHPTAFKHFGDAHPRFDGPVEAGRDYLLVDDTLTQGGTFTSLAAHIRAGGGNVAAPSR